MTGFVVTRLCGGGYFPPADIFLESSPNIRLTEVFLAKTSEYDLLI